MEIKTLCSDMLSKIVDEKLNAYVEGVKFFDQIDDTWRHSDGSAIVFDLITHALATWDGDFVSTGRFGMLVQNRFDMIFKACGRRILLVTGGLRQTAPMDDIWYVKTGMISPYSDKGFALLDDSFYSGKTRNRIAVELEKNGSKLVKSYIIYDGSKVQDPSVTSLYRYYNHYDVGNVRKEA